MIADVFGDIEQAIDWLRKKGLSKAAKKAGRIAAEGLIGIHTAGNAGAMVEVNSETDFVARNEQFQDMVTKIAALAAKGPQLDTQLLAASEVPEPIHRLHMIRHIPADAKAWAAACPRPEGWKDKDA